MPRGPDALKEADTTSTQPPLRASSQSSLPKSCNSSHRWLQRFSSPRQYSMTSVRRTPPVMRATEWYLYDGKTSASPAAKSCATMLPPASSVRRAPPVKPSSSITSTVTTEPLSKWRGSSREPPARPSCSSMQRASRPLSSCCPDADDGIGPDDGSGSGDGCGSGAPADKKGERSTWYRSSPSRRCSSAPPPGGALRRSGTSSAILAEPVPVGRGARGALARAVGRARCRPSTGSLERARLGPARPRHGCAFELRAAPSHSE